MTPILNHYFARINWSGAAAVNIDTLRALHLKHNCTIPFENLDVLLPREIQLDDQSLEEKLVIARRGGYCFEQNGVFERVLRELEFNVRSLLGAYSALFDHGLASKSDQRFASIRSTGNLTFSTAF